MLRIGEYNKMKVDREKSNPIIRIGDLKPSRPDFEIIGVFNAGVAEFREKTILLVRVAEKPISESNTTVSVPIYNPERGEIEILRLQRGRCTGFPNRRYILRQF